MSEPLDRPRPASLPRPPDDDCVVSGDDLETVVLLAEPSESRVVSADTIGRFLGSLPTGGRLAAHSERVASLLDVGVPVARKLLDDAAEPSSYAQAPFEGVSLFHVEGGPAVAGMITGFVRIVGGSSFPSHEHLGTETVFIVQGSCLVEESGDVLRAGDTLVASSDDRHATVARPGPDLVYLAVVEGGIRVGDVTFLPDDPRI